MSLFDLPPDITKLEDSDEAIVIVQSEGAVALMTKAAEELFGVSSEDMVGEFVEMFVPEKKRWGHQAYRPGDLAETAEREMDAGPFPQAERPDRLGDDGYAALSRAHFRILREAVAARGGTEVKNLGDGLMVVFATPARAVECAVAIQQGVEKHNRVQRDDQRMGVRVALHAGEPIQDEADYFGRPVVVAKRLCDQAAGGQIVASTVVRDLVADRRDLHFTELGPVQLKGLADAVTAVEVAWAPIPERVSAFGIAHHQSPFVGRESELSKLIGALERAADGERQVVLVGGEAGVGKTRLAAEFSRLSVEEGALLLYGRCSPDPLVAYEPFVEAFSADGVPSFDELRTRAGLVRGQREAPERSDVTESEEFSERYWLFEEVVGAISAAAAVRPLLLVLDDLHWADRPTLLLFRHLARSMGDPRLVLIGAFREGDPAFDVSRRGVLADLYREGAVHRMTLEGLEEAAGARLVAQRPGGGPRHP